MDGPGAHASLVTDALGIYDVTCLTPGRYTIRIDVKDATAESSGSASYDVELRKGQTKGENFNIGIGESLRQVR